MRNTARGGFRIVRETEAPLPELPYSLDHFSAAGNPIETLGYYPDLASGRGAFDAAVRHRPQRRLCLRNRARVRRIPPRLCADKPNTFLSRSHAQIRVGVCLEMAGRIGIKGNFSCGDELPIEVDADVV